jgi:hypothetical protein
MPLYRNFRKDAIAKRSQKSYTRTRFRTTRDDSGHADIEKSINKIQT